MFHLELFGGRRGLIQLSRDLCAHRYRTSVRFDAQSGKTYDTNPIIKAKCGKSARKPRHRTESTHR
jgi:hypothetical protein